MRCARSMTSAQRAACSGARPGGGSGSVSGGGGADDKMGVGCAVAVGDGEGLREGGFRTGCGCAVAVGGGDGRLGAGVGVAAGGAGEEAAVFASTRAACPGCSTSTCFVTSNRYTKRRASSGPSWLAR